MHDLHRLRLANRGCFAMFFSLGFGYANWLARIPAVRETLALGDRDLGLFLLCGGIGALIAFRMAGLFLARFESRRVASLCNVVFGALLFYPAYTTSVWSASVVLVLIGWCNGLMDVSLNAQAIDVEKKMGKNILAALHGGFSMGGCIGAACGALAASFDVAPARHLGAIGLIVVVASLWASWAMLPDDEPHHVRNEVRLRLPPALLTLGGIAFCSAVGEGAMAEWTAVYLRDELHTSMGVAGAGYAAFSAAMVAGRFGGDRVTAGILPRSLLRRCAFLAAASLSFGLLFNTPPLFCLGVLGTGMGMSLVVPVCLRMAMRIGGIRPARALSTIATLGYGGFLFGPPLIGLWAEASGLRVALLLVVGQMAVLAALAGRVPAELDRR